MNLFSTFNEYRNGNKKAIDDLFTFEDGFKHSYSEAHIILNDPILDALANKIFYHYKTKGKFTKKKNGISKFSEMPYFGTENDVKMEMFIVLKELFSDKNFNPKNSKEVGEVVKYRLQKRLGKIIGKSAYALSENFVNAYGEEISLLDIAENYGLLSYESPFIGNELDENNLKHRHEIAEILNVLNKYGIKSLIQGNAFAQMNFVDFLRENYHLIYDVKEQSMRYPAEKELLEKYCQIYGNVSQQRFSAMLRQLFNLLCSCTVTVNEKITTREVYLNYCEYPGKMNFVDLTSEKTNKMLKLGNELDDYTPLKVYEDAYFNEINNSEVMEICRKNKALIKAIRDKKNLSIEEYSDVLCAVGIMLRDYCKEKVTYQLQRFMFDYDGYTFDINTDKLLNLCMGALPINRYWHIFKSNTGFSLRTFKKCEDGYFKTFTGHGAKVDFVDIKCIRVGFCKFFISDSNKAVYCRAVDRELPFARRVENKIFGLLAA